LLKLNAPAVLQVLEKEYDDLHTIANGLVNANVRSYAEFLYKKCECLLDYIKYYRRTIAEGTTAAWNVVWLFEHQTTACNVHDEFEGKENK
jgi:hypothetical protein